MSSINLLPRSVVAEKKFSTEEKNENVPMALSFLMIIAVSASVAGLFFYNQRSIEKNASLDQEITKIDQTLEDATKNNELMLTETMAKDDSFMLETHPYFSKIIDLIQNNLENQVFLSSIKVAINEENVNVLLEANAKDYLSISNQISIWKRAESVEAVSLGEVSDEDGIYEFPVSINLSKDAIYANKKKTEDTADIKNTEEK